MQLSNLSKIFIILAFCALEFSACNTNGSAADEGISAQGVTGTKTEPPYQNVEADTYEFLVEQSRASGIEKYHIARKGDKSRVDNAYGDPSQTSSLHTDKDYVISASTKSYAEFESGHGYDDRAATVEAVTGGLIGGRSEAVYEKIGSENGMTRYRVTGIAGKPTESIITVDEKLGFPVVKELYRLEGGRALDVTYKISGYKTDVDDALFNFTKDYKKVPLEEIRKTLVPPKQ
jgi:hypothetical protein